MSDEGRMSAAEFAATRQLLGLSYEELGVRLGVRRDTCQRWESGRDAVPLRVGDELASLVTAQGELVQRMLDAEEVVAIRRGDGWQVGAAARALAIEPDIMLEWA